MNEQTTVDDLMRAKASLGVRCRNCDHEGFLSPQTLKLALGPYRRVAKARFSCSRCDRVNVALSIAAGDLGKLRVDPKMHFAGVYENRLD